MADTTKIQEAIETLVEEIDTQLASIVDSKKLVNQLCRRINVPERYTDIQDAGARERGQVYVKADQFANESAPSVAVREYLKLRGQAAGAAKIAEIFQALKAGGFNFRSKEDSQNLGGLRVAIGKDRSLLRIGTSDSVGLLEWYPKRKERIVKARGNGDESVQEENLDGTDDAEMEDDSSSAAK